MMKRLSWGMLFFLITVILSGCSEDDFDGRTFKVTDSTNTLETKTESTAEVERYELLSLTFDSGVVTVNSAEDLRGEYTAVDDQLEISLMGREGELLLVFSDLASSVEENIKYQAEISTVDYSMERTEDLAHLEFISIHDQEGREVFFEEIED